MIDTGWFHTVMSSAERIFLSLDPDLPINPCLQATPAVSTNNFRRAGHDSITVLSTESGAWVRRCARQHAHQRAPCLEVTACGPLLLGTPGARLAYRFSVLLTQVLSLRLLSATLLPVSLGAPDLALIVPCVRRRGAPNHGSRAKVAIGGGG